jgi:hypothetical protein
MKREAGRLRGARGFASGVIFRKVEPAESQSYFWDEKTKLAYAAAGQSPPQKLRLKAEQSSAEDTEPRLLFLNSAAFVLYETIKVQNRHKIPHGWCSRRVEIVTLLLNKVRQVDKVQGSEWDWAGTASMGEKSMKFWLGNLKKREDFENSGVDWKSVYKWTIQKQKQGARE